MFNNIYMQENALEQEQRNRTREIENRHTIAVSTDSHNGIRHLIGSCGTFLVMLGTRLEQAERREIPVRV